MTKPKRLPVGIVEAGQAQCTALLLAVVVVAGLADNPRALIDEVEMLNRLSPLNDEAIDEISCQLQALAGELELRANAMLQAHEREIYRHERAN